MFGLAVVRHGKAVGEVCLVFQAGNISLHWLPRCDGFYQKQVPWSSVLWSVLIYKGAEAVSGVPSSVRGCHPTDTSAKAAGLCTAGAGRAPLLVRWDMEMWCGNNTL